MDRSGIKKKTADNFSGLLLHKIHIIKMSADAYFNKESFSFVDTFFRQKKEPPYLSDSVNFIIILSYL